MSGHNGSGWNDAQQRLMQAPDAVIKRVHSVWTGFIDFAARDNVLEVAVGLMLASSFTAIVNALVSEVILPPISLIPGLTHKNLPDKFLVLRKGPHGDRGYNTLDQAHADGAVTLGYGVLLDRLFSFITLGLVLYGVAVSYGAVTHDNIIKHTVKCAYCRKDVSDKAKRCYLCTSWLDGREDRETSALGP